MYHCHIQFYLIGQPCAVFQAVKALPPLDHFSHGVWESETVDTVKAAQADVIFAALDAGGIRALAQQRKPGAELILLGTWTAGLPQADDLWRPDMEPEELAFRLGCWQQRYRQRCDAWESQHFLDACINGSPDLVWFKTKDGIHELVNDSFCVASGKTKEQIHGQGHAYIWDVEAEDPACIESEAEVMRRRETCMSEEHIITGDGPKILTTYKSPLYDLDGSVMGTVGVALDVTRERAYEQAIVEKNLTLEKLFSSIDCGMMTHSLDGKEVLSINRAALELLGYETQYELMEDGFDLIAQSVLPEDQPKLRDCINSLTIPGDNVSLEYRVQHKDGELLYILGNIKLIEENGELYYQRFLLDFTDQKLQEVERWEQRDQEARYQERIFEIFSNFLSDNVDDIYLMLNIEDRDVEFVSTNIERILGIPWADVKSDLTLLRDVTYVDEEPLSMEELLQMEPGCSPFLRETERVNQQTGEHKWFLESIYCVAVEEAKKIIVYISDRTKERTTQNTLSEALDMAKVANKAKNTFLSNVSHDIRTPMNAIMGLLPLLEAERDNPDHVLEYTQKISAASQHLLGLINDVLDLNKIESGSAVLNIGELNMAQVIDELNAIIRPQVRAKEQTFDVYASSLTYEHLLGDRLRINQILLNILSNAVKYTPAGGQIELWVYELPQVDPNYSRIRFTVRDNGQGMSEEYQKVIFDPFTRETHTSLNKIQGTGLGMAITKSLVDLMSGSISVQSALGQGSTFTVELELRIQETVDDPKFWADHGVKRMLIADDDEDICRDILKKMSGTGVITHYATRGDLALEMMQEALEHGVPYDLLLLDWRMPDLDGMETTRRIRATYPEKVPILLFTAYDWADIEQEALEVGIDHFLQKPFFMSNFRDAIHRMIRKQLPEPNPPEESPVAGKSILVVDDIDVNRMILVKILGALGAVCDTANNGQEALEKFESAPGGGYDIILMDIQMPVMNGHEATRAIRASGRDSAQTVAILAMTANAFVDDIRDALDAGMDAHIPKPIVLEQLTATIRDVLQRKTLEAPPSA